MIKNLKVEESKTENLASRFPQKQYPSQNLFEFSDGVVLDSCFDSGNLGDAKLSGLYQYDLWVAPDAVHVSPEMCYRSWFYFRVKNVPMGVVATFTIKNMNSQAKLYSEGLRPYFKSNYNGKWEKLNDPKFSATSTDKIFELTFHYTFMRSENEEVYFAFTVPWSYEEDQKFINQLQKAYQDDCMIYFNRETLVYSLDKRRVDLLTISSRTEMLSERESGLPNLLQGEKNEVRPFKFDPTKKKYVFVSARVHPGETAASHVMRRFLQFLLDPYDVRAMTARDQYVFCVIPMLNPDGVYRGNYRADSLGQNLNRYYINPTITEQPTIYAAKSIIMDLHRQGKLVMYLDLHAHASKKGCFVYGNSLEYRQQIQSHIFPKLLSLNSRVFEYESCSFSDGNVKVIEKGKMESKEGAGRVAIYKATNLVNCYTLECNYNSGKVRNMLTEPISIPLTIDEERPYNELDVRWEKVDNPKYECLDSYTVEEYEEIGEAIVISLTELHGFNPLTRLLSSPYVNMRNLKLKIALNLLREAPFRHDTYLASISKNLEKNIGTLMTYVNDNIKKEIKGSKKKRNTTSSTSRRITLIPKKLTPIINIGGGLPSTEQQPMKKTVAAFVVKHAIHQPQKHTSQHTQQIRVKKDIIIKKVAQPAKR